MAFCFLRCSQTYQQLNNVPESDPIAQLIMQIITKSHMTQKEAAEVLGMTQPKVSLIMNGRLEDFSLERLIMAMTSLDRDVEIRIRKKPRSREHARLNVVYV
ncbi:putative XRE-type DNA-binding protein [Geothermobacter ehrlichii]|uniref:Putative XRE-type DNA-binding protein n=1 Tax=Geothermobacter ehrlichii TaxID=213224 RepID=A0A5D3WJL2_9BACT|nr:putative XRE-type DNA-binding protein [Geothermobacter ehrlichii]